MLVSSKRVARSSDTSKHVSVSHLSILFQADKIRKEGGRFLPRLKAVGARAQKIMDFPEVVLKRRMVRHFTSEPVAPEIIDHVLTLARHAPSAGFTQGQSFIVVTRPELKQALARLCGEEGYVARGFHPFISEAPVLIIPCTSEAAYHRRYQEPDKLNDEGAETNWPVPYWHMDIGCAVMVLLLAVVNEGLAAGFAGADNLDDVRALLNIPAEVIPVGVIPVGHPAKDVPSPSLKRGRKSDADYTHHEGW